jgi:chromosome segregation ATPase
MSLPADVLPEKIAQLEKKIADTNAILSNCYLEVENAKIQQKNLEIQVAAKSEALEVYERFKKLDPIFDSIQKKLVQLDDHKDMLQAVIREIKNGYIEFSDLVKHHQKQFLETQTCIEQIKSSLQLAKTELDQNMHFVVEKAKKDMQQKMDALPIPKCTVSTQQMHSYIKEVLQGIELDAKNAFDSSKTSEIRLDVLDKKIESLLIKIRNVELKGI